MPGKVWLFVLGSPSQSCLECHIVPRKDQPSSWAFVDFGHGIILEVRRALFEYLITMAKVRYLSRNIDERQKENDKLREEIHRGVKYIEQTQDELKKALELAGKGSPQGQTRFLDSASE